MKKVLLGLLALSAVSMAAAPNYGDAAKPNTNVFQTGQEGAISITGKITSTVPVVKYVVFGSVDGTTAEDTLILKDFVLSQNAAEAGFGGTNPKVYVKRVNGTDDGFVDLEAGDEVKFKVAVDSFYTSFAPIWGQKQTSVIGTTLLSKATLEEIITATGDSGFVVSPFGTIIKNGLHYRGAHEALFETKENGVLEISNRVHTDPTMGSPDIAAIQTAFAGGKAISNAKILVRVD